MGILEDVMKTLERIPLWKRLGSVPSEVDALKQRVAALEAKLQPATGDQCPKCRGMSFTLQETTPAPGAWGSMGVVNDRLACSGCGHTETRQRDTFRR